MKNGYFCWKWVFIWYPFRDDSFYLKVPGRYVFLPGQMIEVGANQLDFVGYKWDRETLLKLQSFHGKVLFLSTSFPALYVASVQEPSLLWNVFLPGRRFWSTCMRLAWSVAFWRISRKSWVTRLSPGRHRLLCWLLQLEEATPAEWVLELNLTCFFTGVLASGPKAVRVRSPPWKMLNFTLIFPA